MVRAFTVTALSSELILIRWTGTATPHEEMLFIQQLQKQLNEAAQPLYFLSDLRSGRMVGVRAIGDLGKLTQHRNWAGSTAFTQSLISRLYAGNFRTVTRQSDSETRNLMFDTSDEALAFLESLRPGITTNIDWVTVLA